MFAIYPLVTNHIGSDLSLWLDAIVVVASLVLCSLVEFWDNPRWLVSGWTCGMRSSRRGYREEHNAYFANDHGCPTVYGKLDRSMVWREYPCAALWMWRLSCFCWQSCFLRARAILSNFESLVRTRPTLNTCGHKYYSSKHGKVGTDKCLGSIRSTIMEDDLVKGMVLGITLTLTLSIYCHVLWLMTKPNATW